MLEKSHLQSHLCVANQGLSATDCVAIKETIPSSGDNM